MPPASPIALEALERIAALFAIESSIRGRPSDQRGAAREEHARPLLVQLKTFLDTSLNRVSGKSALAQAIRYTRSRWQALTRYVTDGRLEMSNNAAERAMKPSRDARIIVHLLFKYLETLEADCRHRCDTGVLYARPSPPRTVRPGPRPGFGTARREQPARREGCQP